MLHKLENDLLCITVDDHGAELRSITGKSDRTEYLWNGDPAWWKYTSPVLFPIVGKLSGGIYRAEGREYALPGHGFARVSEFQCIREAKDELIFSLEYSPDTLKVYPYKFRLEIAYILKNNQVEISWTVHNLDDKTIWFSIGSHPALRCPITEGEEFSDCYLKFDYPEKASRLVLNEDGTLSRREIPTLDGKELPLSYELFREDALVFHGLKSDEVSICSRKSAKSIKVCAKGFPWWGFWTPAKGGAPFLCIEPWLGHADFEDVTGELSEKDAIQHLSAGSSLDVGYRIIIQED